MARLVTLHAGQARLPLEIPLAAMVLVGSSPDCDLCIDSPAVSRRHCRIVFRGDAWVVEDLGSTNGVHVNDVPRGQSLPLTVIAARPR